LVYPVTLNADYSYNAFPTSKSIFEPQTLFSVIALIVILYVILRLLKSHKLYAFCGLWFFITLLPVCQIIPHHELLAEHYLYLPAFGFCLLLALLFEKLLSFRKYKYIAYSLFTVIIVLYSYRVIDRNRDWKDDLTLWSKTTETAPNCLRARYGLGRAHQAREMANLAIVQYKKVFEIAPQVTPNNKAILAWAHNNLGRIYLEKELLDEAEIEYKEALQIFPKLSRACHDLGTIYHKKGLLEEAIIKYQRALSVDPNFAIAHCNLGNVYYVQGLFDKAISEYKKALDIDSNLSQPYQGLITIYLRIKGDSTTAHYYFKKLQELKQFKSNQ
jgi:tetratricopeptide (TPR) repeat protein